MKNIVKVVVAVVAVVSLSVIAAHHEEKLEDRIKPEGKVCKAGEDCAAAPAAAASSGAEGRSGSVVYETKCLMCHGTGAAGAPKLGDAAAWAPRIAKGMDVLYSNSVKGFNGMPAKGLCFDCSDSEMNAAVDYMVEKSK